MYEGVYEGEPIDVKERLREEQLEGNISKLALSLECASEQDVLREMYTEILLREDVVEILTGISREKCFVRDFPEFYEKNRFGEDVINCPQNSKYHRYGVFKHTLMSVELAGKYNNKLGNNELMILKWTMLLHDIGKPYVKFIKEDGKESFKGHDDKSVQLATKILERFNFSDRNKRIILKLIDFHDKLTNEGDIVYDNLKVLAVELDNKRNLFNLLVEVKEADANAKCIEVAEKFKIIKKKYMDFSNTYFDSIENNLQFNTLDGNNNALNKSAPTSELQNMNNVQNTGGEEIIGGSSGVQNIAQIEENIPASEYESVVDNILNKNIISTIYQPIIDIDRKQVFGYETFSKVESTQRIKIDELLKYAQENDKYDRINQVMLINNIHNFLDIPRKESSTGFFNMDIDSYDKYINKPRLYDQMMKFKFVMELHAYDKYPSGVLNDKITSVINHHGEVCLDNFGANRYNIEDITSLKVKYIKLDKSVIENIEVDEKKQEYLNRLLTVAVVSDIIVIAMGVETKEQFGKLKNMGIKYMQGRYFAIPTDKIDMINGNIGILLGDGAYESIII